MSIPNRKPGRVGVKKDSYSGSGREHLQAGRAYSFFFWGYGKHLMSTVSPFTTTWTQTLGVHHHRAAFLGPGASCPWAGIQRQDDLGFGLSHFTPKSCLLAGLTFSVLDIFGAPSLMVRCRPPIYPLILVVRILRLSWSWHIVVSCTSISTCRPEKGTQYGARDKGVLGTTLILGGGNWERWGCFGIDEIMCVECRWRVARLPPLTAVSSR